MQELLNQISKFYPKGLDYDRDFIEYIASQQYQRLDKTVSAFHRSSTLWDEHINSMNESLDIRFYRQMPNHLDRCLSYQMKLPGGLEKNARINLDISSLAPICSLFIIRRWFDEEGYNRISKDSETDPLKMMRAITAHTHYSKSHDYEEVNMSTTINAIINYISSTWDYTQLPAALFDVEIRDYSFDQKDRCLTYYTAFFQSHPIIQ